MGAIASRSFVLLLIPVVAVFAFDLGAAFAQESTERYILHRVEIWGLFYRLMVVAFVIGAVVMGTIAYVVWRFRESNPKNIPREPVGSAHH